MLRFICYLLIGLGTIIALIRNIQNMYRNMQFIQITKKNSKTCKYYYKENG